MQCSNLHVFLGHYQSVRPGTTGLQLIVDKKAGAFYPNKSVMDFVSYYYHDDQRIFNLLADRRVRQEMENLFKKVKFMSFHLKHKMGKPTPTICFQFLGLKII